MKKIVLITFVLLCFAAACSDTKNEAPAAEKSAKPAFLSTSLRQAES